METDFVGSAADSTRGRERNGPAMNQARTGPQRKAVELLVEDVVRRSGIRWYAGDSFRNLIRLDADEHPVHEWFKKPDPPVPVEFGMLSQATADGTLTLTWRHEPGKGANGRGCQVAKVWLIRK